MKITGLTDAQVQEAKAKFGDNSITEQAREGFWDKLKGNFDDPIIKILLGMVRVRGHRDCGFARDFRFDFLRVQERERVPKIAGRGLTD